MHSGLEAHMVEMKIDYMFTRGDELRARGPYDRNENINGYMFTRGDELRTGGPHGRNENQAPRIRGPCSKETVAARGSVEVLLNIVWPLEVVETILSPGLEDPT